MPPPPDDPAGDAFFVIAPGGRDANVVCHLLASAGLAHVRDDQGERLLGAIAGGEGAGAIVTDLGIARIGNERLREVIERQPPWSDFPFILLTRRGEPAAGSRTIEELVNVTLLERPLHPATLISAARSALRGRMRQRLAARHLQALEQTQRELRELADTLEEKVAVRTQALAAANDQLTREIADRERAEARLIQAQKMEAIGQLTGGIAHDFNNLLTVVVGSLDLLIKHCGDERSRKLARNALRAAERGSELTGQLLAFSRRQRLSPTRLQPNEIVAGMRELLARSIGPHVQVETRLEPGLWLALADPTQLEMMILNLAINARDAMAGGGRMVIATRNVETVPPALAGELDEGPYVAISVSDNGRGMSPAVAARAFEPFFTTKETGKGTGLGLAQLYGFAKQSGGTAKIDTREGEGTTVTIYLPRTDGAAAPAEAAPGKAAASGGEHVLVVDDDPAVREVLAEMAAELGYRVATAESGAEALRRLGNGERFALMLTDVAMPEMNGVELARAAREAAPGMPIGFASGYADLRTFGAELADEVVLKKPYRMHEVAARIQWLLSEAAEDGKVVEGTGV